MDHKNKILILIISILCSISSFGQDQKNFKENQFLRLKDGKYLTYKNDPTIFLHKKKKVGTNDEELYFSVVNGDTIRYYKKVNEFKRSAFNVSDFPSLQLKRFKGDFKIEKDTLYFYPWKFKDEADVPLKNELDKYSFYIPLPSRTVVKVKFYSFQYGVLTLPAKFFLQSKSDSLVSNVQTDVNLNFMLGFKWGNKKYSNLPNKTEGTSYESAWSINAIFGISKVELSETNTTPIQNKTYSVGALSSGLAFGYQYRSIGIYLATGLDTPLSKYGDNWNFKNKPWLGFGLGLGF